jgi:hypothetical protein
MTISFEEIKELIPKKTSGYYVDYRDDLSNSLDKAQEAIQTQSIEPFAEIFDDWFPDYDYEKSELELSLSKKYELSSEDVKKFIELFKDQIEDEFENRDNSTPLNDLLSNTGKQTMFYDTGYSMHDGSWNWTDKEIAVERQSIKKVLGVRSKDETLNAKLDMMIRQASYGGKLVIYFYDKVNDYISIPDIEKIKYIQFDRVHIAIIDVHQGSGDNCYLGDTVKLPFNPKNIFICSTFKYSYTHSVCGMSSNWCDDTIVSFKAERFRRKFNLIESTYNQHLEKEKKLNLTYKNGSCTAGDMDITRHRNTTYINEFLCGNKCLDCNTFWID